MERSADWIDQARRDLAHAQQDLETGFYEWACFSAQQAAEKAVKAVFQKLNLEAWGHSAADLLQALPENAGEVPGDIVDKAFELDKAYIPTRYPDAHQSGSPRQRYRKSEAERLVNHARDVIRFCEGVFTALHDGDGDAGATGEGTGSS
ncbi:MAG: HEPN domain-containing protein [Gemmatimonadota bacterium]